MEREPSIDPVTQRLGEHYARTFAEHGATARGVDWGTEESVRLRYDRMLAVADGPKVEGDAPPRWLDVGCGFGGLYGYARELDRAIDYTGIDVVAPMIDHARGRFPEATFLCDDVFAIGAARSFDYVVANGILTQKLETTIAEMDDFARRLIVHLFTLCDRGVAFNVMTNRVNFMAGNLYYKSPVEMLEFCLSHVTRHVRIDHAYPLYEYTVYLYRG